MVSVFIILLYSILEPGNCRSGPLQLAAGGHEYTFQYQLPQNLPSSFESQDVCKGRVHYMLRARLDSPDENIRQSRERTFIVLSVLDLNREPRTVVSDPDYCLGIGGTRIFVSPKIDFTCAL